MLKDKTKQHSDSTAADYDNSHDSRFVRRMYEEIAGRTEQALAVIS